MRYIQLSLFPMISVTPATLDLVDLYLRCRRMANALKGIAELNDVYLALEEYMIYLSDCIKVVSRDGTYKPNPKRKGV